MGNTADHFPVSLLVSLPFFAHLPPTYISLLALSSHCVFITIVAIISVTFRPVFFVSLASFYTPLFPLRLYSRAGTGAVVFVISGLFVDN